MAFYGCQFSFDGVPSFEYGLMIYDIGSPNETGMLSPAVKIIEDRTSRRYNPLHYGITQSSPLTFSLVFGADIDSIDKGEHLDRWDMEAVASWLTGHDDYKYLEIMQPDMDVMRYKCIISKLEYTTYGNIPWAFKCEVTCDSPFAYLYPEVVAISVDGTSQLLFNCRASSKYYYPMLNIHIESGDYFSIINHSDNDREFLLSNISQSPISIMIDNENEIITNSEGLNSYKYFNFNFLRLVKGYNDLEFKGSARIEMKCEFPINIGG